MNAMQQQILWFKFIVICFMTSADSSLHIISNVCVCMVVYDNKLVNRPIQQEQRKKRKEKHNATINKSPTMEVYETMMKIGEFIRASAGKMYSNMSFVYRSI